MVCSLCGSHEVKLIHKGTRDDPTVNVYRCLSCGLKFLDRKKVEDVSGFYENGGMHTLTPIKTDSDIETILEQSRTDDTRRVQTLAPYVQGKTVLDFGCGWGG